MTLSPSLVTNGCQLQWSELVAPQWPLRSVKLSPVFCMGFIEQPRLHRVCQNQENKYTRCIFFNESPKRLILIKFIFSRLSSTLIWNAKLIQKVAFPTIFRRFQKFKNIACSMSQSVTKCCNKNVAPYSGRDKISLPMILNTDHGVEHIYISPELGTSAQWSPTS